MKIIFLDIDGVLIKYPSSDKEFEEAMKGRKKIGALIVGWDKEAKNNLKKIIKETGAKIVISSSWRKIPILVDEIKSNLNEIGVGDEGMIGMTDCIGFDRDFQILRYLMKENSKGNAIEKFIVIDDDEADLHIVKSLGRLVKVNVEKGLTEKDALKAIELLNTDFNSLL